MSRSDPVARKGRIAALVIAGTALAWILFGLIAEKEGFSQSTRLIFDLVALAGFMFAFWLIFQIWRARQNDGN
jgi:threonine/homoserine/homoserine lactone efflux protein